MGTAHGGSRRAPPDELSETETARPAAGSSKSETLGKGVSRIAINGVFILLTLGSAAAAAATVRTWPAVVALIIVMIGTLIWVALGPTFSSTEAEVDERTKVHQYQLTFARRAPVRTHVTSRPISEPSADDRHDVGATTAAIRAWARSEGMDVGHNGPLPREVVQAWESRRGKRLDSTATKGQ